MSSKNIGKRPLRTLSAHEKLEAIRRVHDGESKASVARDIGVPESTLRGWCKNEDKISYLSRQSTPEEGECSPTLVEPKEKKPKIDEPYNLSVKNNVAKNNSSFTSNGNGSTKNITSTNNITPSKSYNYNNNDCKTTGLHQSERERNRAELARLSVELGLNRPEMFLNNLNGNNSLTELTAGMNLLAQWNSLLQGAKISTSSSDNSMVTSSDMLTTKTQHHKTTKLPKPDKPSPGVDESVWYWLKNNPGLLGIASTPLVASTSATTPVLSSTTTVPATTSCSSSFPKSLQTSTLDSDSHQRSRFWKWYQQFANLYSQSSALPEKPILYQQLTKDISNSENVLTSSEKIHNSKKVRAVLDSLLLNNNNNNLSSKKQEAVTNSIDLLTPPEALEHGEKFLNWLENCGDPTVTAMQIMQFRLLLNNIKNNVDRKNGDTLHKNKVRRK